MKRAIASSGSFAVDTCAGDLIRVNNGCGNPNDKRVPKKSNPIGVFDFFDVHTEFKNQEKHVFVFLDLRNGKTYIRQNIVMRRNARERHTTRVTKIST